MNKKCYWIDIDDITVHDLENDTTKEVASNIEICGDFLWINLQASGHDLRVIIESEALAQGLCLYKQYQKDLDILKKNLDILKKIEEDQESKVSERLKALGYV